VHDGERDRGTGGNDHGGNRLATIGSDLNAAHMAAAPTVAVVPAAADEVSASIAQVFSQHAANYQGLAAQAAAFHEQFVQNLKTSAGWYAATEAANAAVLQPLTASAGSFTSAVAALPGQILNLLNSANAALGQLLNSLTGFLTKLATGALGVLGVIVFLAFLIVIILWIQILNTPTITMIFSALQALGI
jgi:hypothetical protein